MSEMLEESRMPMDMDNFLPTYYKCEACGDLMPYRFTDKEESEGGRYGLISKHYRITYCTLVEKEGVPDWSMSFDDHGEDQVHICMSCAEKFKEMMRTFLKGG